jgi:hypothetical protein
MEPILEMTPAEKIKRKSLEALKAEISMRMRFLGLDIVDLVYFSDHSVNFGI